MESLAQVLTEPSRRPEVVAALAGVVQDEVASRSGLGGAALRTTLGAATRVRPQLVSQAVEKLLPDIAAALEPYWATRSGAPFGEHLAAHSDDVANALLAVADGAAGRAGRGVGQVYATLRPGAHGNVVRSLPRLGAAVERLAR